MVKFRIELLTLLKNGVIVLYQITCNTINDAFLQNLKNNVGFEFWSRLKSMFDIGYFGCFQRTSSLQLNLFVMDFTASEGAVIIIVRHTRCNEILQDATGKNVHFSGEN